MTPAFDCILPSALATAENLPSLPGVAVRILELSRSADSGLDDYAKVISMDPALSTRILSLANSSLYSLGQDITTVDRATMVLGTKTVQLMSLSFSLVAQMPSHESDESFDYSGYWSRSLTAAVAGRELGRMLGFALADEAFLCGLLSRIGQLVIAECMPEDYEKVLAVSNGFPSRSEENEHLGFNHGDIGAALMKEWGLPEPLYLSVAFAHAPQDYPEPKNELAVELVSITHVASLIVSLLCEPDKGEVLGELQERTSELGLSSEQTHTLILALEARIKETASLFEIVLPDKQSHYDILDSARKQLVSVSVSAVREFKTIERRAGNPHVTTETLITEENTDKLTGLGDRSFFEESLALELNNNQFSQVPAHIGVLLIDIAEFDQIISDYGASFAEQAISVVGQTLRGMCRSSDTPARYSDHTFAILLPSTGAFSLRALARRITNTIIDMPIVAGQERFRVSACIGGSVFTNPVSDDDRVQLVRSATEALAQANRLGPGNSEIKSC